MAHKATVRVFYFLWKTLFWMMMSALLLRFQPPLDMLPIHFLRSHQWDGIIFVFSHRLKTFGGSTTTFLSSWSYWRHWQSTSSWYLWWRRYIYMYFFFLFVALHNIYLNLMRRDTHECFKMSQFRIFLGLIWLLTLADTYTKYANYCTQKQQKMWWRGAKNPQRDLIWALSSPKATLFN